MKGGTTILYDYINEHPDVTPAKKKEVHFFSLYAHRGLEWYQTFFEPHARVTGEASPTYFDVAVTLAVPELIKSTLSEVKIILIVRDPVERAVSQFYHLQNVNKIEEICTMEINEFFGGNFSDAISQTTTHDIYLYQALNFSCYYRKLQNYLAVFGRENILVLSNGMLRKNPDDTMRRTFEFLGLEPLEGADFARVKYSSGKGVENLSDNIQERLERFLYRDYDRFRELVKTEWGTEIF